MPIVAYPQQFTTPYQRHRPQSVATIDPITKAFWGWIMAQYDLKNEGRAQDFVVNRVLNGIPLDVSEFTAEYTDSNEAAPA